MARNVKLLLTENVDSLGIVGDVVNVRLGYARNFLLPRNMATTPSEEALKAVAAKRAAAEKELAELRKVREQLVGKLQGVEVTMVRSCNDQGILYGGVTQQDVATALTQMGYAVKPREVRLGQPMKRVDHYEVHVKLDSDLDALVKVHVQPDRKLDLDKLKAEEAAEEVAKDKAIAREEAREDKRDRDRPRRGDMMAALIDKALQTDRPKGWAPAADKGDAAAAPSADKGGKSEKGDKGDKAKGDKPAKAEKPAKGDKPAKADGEKKAKKG